MDILITCGYFSMFIALDRLITRIGLDGVYYFVHAIHNACMIYTTAPEVYTTLTDFTGLAAYPTNMNAVSLCFALHFYHIALYHKKFRYDDWLHHILMIFIALPIGLFVPSSTLLGYSLFFTTGLPGGIDYAILFGVRNNWIPRMTEKRINNWLNVWIRSPGCASHAALTLAYICSTQGTTVFQTIGCIPPLLVFWNGQYFMQQVVEDYTTQLIHDRTV